jgi:hypothetical protein
MSKQIKKPVHVNVWEHTSGYGKVIQLKIFDKSVCSYLLKYIIGNKKNRKIINERKKIFIILRSLHHKTS